MKLINWANRSDTELRVSTQACPTPRLTGADGGLKANPDQINVNRLPLVTTDDDYEELAPGTEYIAPDGKRRKL